jgi:hypothetical protein
MSEEETPKPIRGRPFAPGNPGRPAGSRNKATRMLEQKVADEANNLLGKLIELGLGGDVKSIQYCLDHLWTKPKGRPIEFQLPAINTAHDVLAAMAAISTAINEGNLTPQEADHLARLLQTHAKAIEINDLAGRLEALELQITKKGTVS